MNPYDEKLVSMNRVVDRTMEKIKTLGNSLKEGETVEVSLTDLLQESAQEEIKLKRISKTQDFFQRQEQLSNLNPW